MQLSSVGLQEGLLMGERLRAGAYEVIGFNSRPEVTDVAASVALSG